ncbi:MAG: hypothetical protein RIG82_05810 [Phycisphaeraceae bacterium]
MHQLAQLRGAHAGQRGDPPGAFFTGEFHESLTMINPVRFEQLRYACQYHTLKTHSNDPTIWACWDADRLDLGRVGITPSPRYLNTHRAKEIAWDQAVHLLAEQPIRSP